MSIKKQAISGVKWTTISTVILAFSAILKISILTRFLDKSDFGLMALVMFVLGFMNLFMDMGLTSAILHKQGITKNEYASLYWLNFGFSIVLYVIILVLTPFVANFYEQPELNILIPLMGLGLIISAIGKQFKTIQQKKLKFKTIASIDISVGVLSLLVSVYLAYTGFGVYALVYSALFQYVLSNVLFLTLGIKQVGLKLRYKFTETKPFLRIGMYRVGGQVVNYFNKNLDTLIIGKYFGTEILGGYNLAKQLVFRPAQIINPILTRVASPVLAKFQDNASLLKKNYLKLVNIVATINIPIYIAVIIFAPLIVRILYGNNFDSIVILVQILSIFMMFRAIGNPIGSLVIATGRTDLEFKWNVFTLLITPLAIFIGSQFSIQGVAIASAITSVLLFIPSWNFLIHKMLGVGLKEYIQGVFSLAFLRNLIANARRYGKK